MVATVDGEQPRQSGETMRTGTREPMLRRIFGRGLMDMALLLLVGVLLSDLRQPKGMFTDPDLWWHIANGRIVEQAHVFIRMEPYAFTVAGQPWIDPEWLSGLLYWLGYKHLGYVGIVAVAAVGILGNVLLLYRRSSRESGSAAVALWTTILGILLMTVNSSARMILFGYLGLGVEMAILEGARKGRTKGLWLLPPLFCAWINLHGSWVIGMTVLALYIACGWLHVEKGIFAQRAFSAAQRKRLLAVFVACVALLFVNPYGWRLLWNPFDMQFGQKLNMGHVQEWQPVNLNEFLGKMVLLAILLMLSANLMKGRKWTVFEMALFLFAWYEALAHVRFTFLATVLTMPMIATDVARVFFPPTGEEKKTIPLMNGLIAAGVLVVLVWNFIPHEPELRSAVAEEIPLKTIALLQPGWRTLNQDNFGGLMDFHGKPAFIDSRFDTFEHHGVMKDFLDIFQLHDSFKLMEKYRIDHVLARENEPLAYLLEHSPGWTIVTREGKGDTVCVLFARTAAAQQR